MTKFIALGRTVDGRLFPIAVDGQGRLVIAHTTGNTFTDLFVTNLATIQNIDVNGTAEFENITANGNIDADTLAVTTLANLYSLYAGNQAGGSYTNFETDGTMQAFGDATCWRDELQSITGAQIDSPAGDFQRNNTEGSVTAKTSSRYPADYVWGSWQLNHDWSLGTSVKPHIHWWQTTANTPNWLFAYRWQKQGKEKTTAWSLLPRLTNAYPWGAYTTLNQITSFGSIAAPVGYGEVSDIIQIRLYRDYTNVSTLFTGNDPVNASQEFINIDGHIQIDMLGSREEYEK